MKVVPQNTIWLDIKLLNQFRMWKSFHRTRCDWIFS